MAGEAAPLGNLRVQALSAAVDARYTWADIVWTGPTGFGRSISFDLSRRGTSQSACGGSRLFKKMPKYVVRHGVMRHLGIFSTSRGETFGRGARVIARTSRGLESGEVLCDSTEQTATNLKDAKNGQILRRMSPQDELESKKMSEQEVQEFEACQKRMLELKLEMKLVDLEHLYGGERVIIYYLAEGRVDFRQLVKVLAGEFQTRIEMRQIGVRDEAKLLADYGDCGKPVCCNTHLSEMPPVSMRMAKLQKATLDPNKISGRCGRLKCCLRYEYDTYLELQKGLPPIGSQIVTTTGRARVLAHEILANQVLVESEDMRRVLINAGDVLSVIAKGAPEAKKDAKGSSTVSKDSKSKDSKSDDSKPAEPKDKK